MADTAFPVTGVDVSRFQAQDPENYANPIKMNWQQALDSGIEFAIIRCGHMYYEDWTYEYNRSELERLKIPFSAYHAWYPGADNNKQIQFFLDHMAGHLYQCADVEVAGTMSKSVRASRCKEYLEGVTTPTFGKPMVYTRASWWDPYIGNVSWAKYYKLLIAHYGDLLRFPAIPEAWKSTLGQNCWTFWQWSADGNGQGAKYGAQSTSIDLDRYNGTKEQFMSEFNIDETPVEPPVPVPVTGLKFRVGVPLLNIRSGPGTQYTDIGDLAGNQVVEAINVNGSDSWIEIEPGKWACVQKGSTQYMTVVTEG